MKVRKIKGTWWIDYVDFGGKRHREKIGLNKRAAQSALASQEKAKAEGRYLNVKPDQKTNFEDIAKDFLRYSETNKRSFSRDQIIVEHLRKEFGGKKLSEITPLTIETYKANRLNDGVKGSTINREMAALKCAFNLAIDGKKASENPVSKVKFFQEDNARLRFLEPDEITGLIQQCAPHLKPIVLTALLTGMRRGEILGLKWTDIDFGRSLLTLEKTKSGKSRTIEMSALLTNTLKECFNTTPDPAGYVFCKPDGRAIKKIRTAFEAACRRAKIDDFTFHGLRHTAASYLVMLGNDLVTVKEILGHSKVEMTLRYSHLSKPHKKSAMEILGAKMSAMVAQTGHPVGTKVNSEDESISKVVDNTTISAG